MKKYIFFLTFILFSFSTLAQWQKLYDNEYNYIISFPGIAEKKFNPNTGDIIYVFKDLDYFFMASVSVFKRSLPLNFSIEDISESSFMGFANSFNAIKISDKKIYYQNYEGWEYFFSVNNMAQFKNGIIRLILAEKRMVMLVYICSVYDNEIYNKFFNSLVIK